MNDTAPGQRPDGKLLQDRLAGLEIVDCDVHPIVPGGMATLYPFLPKAWVQRFELKNATSHRSALTLRFEHPSGSAIRADAVPPKGGVPGSDPDFIESDLLDQHDIAFAVLNSLQAGAMAAVLTGPDESIVLSSAYNDYFLDGWNLAARPRLRLAMTVPSQDPQAAAAEIRRVGKRREVAAVSLPLIDVLMGNRYYHPIYAEAEAHGLPILVHVTGTDTVYRGAPTSSGHPENYAERYVSLSQIGEANFVSLMFSGTLERFPKLKFIFVEFSFAWAVPLMWRIERTWQSLRYDTPWVKKSPWEYLRAHIRFSTQPLDEPRSPTELAQMIAMLGPEQLLFATDYPHWDNDMPGQSLTMLAPEAQRLIFAENARTVLRLA
jgi:predicted TIM-barrel fold metal-dependent hydrolase